MSRSPATPSASATARVGANSFLGTDVFVPPGARLGDNCLLGTKVMAPIDGPLRENVGLLGSPAFEIPRAAARDLELVGRLDAAERRRRLRAKDPAQPRHHGDDAGQELRRRVRRRSMC